MIKIYDSLTKEKQLLQPLTPGVVKMYVCGITVYDFCHIGHARASIMFDIVARYLRFSGYEVIYVHNITDIDDKIIQRAKENHETCEALTERFIAAMHADEQALGVQPPTHEPRATAYIQPIIDLIGKIMAQGHAYVANNGDVCFDVRRFQTYGQLSQRNIDELIAGARVSIDEGKRDPLDFVLWKRSKADGPEWDSPWGSGRPGWHIECSAMSTALLGQPFDIHGGGLDLKFPHHENEIAQSEAAYGKPFANIWMHVGLLQVNKEKMSKSLGNFYTIRDVLQQHHPEVLRYFMLSAHYRSPVNYSEDNLQQARQALEHLYRALRGLSVTSPEQDEAYIEKFKTAMNDDFNTPQALAVLFEIAHTIHKYREQQQFAITIVLANTLKFLAGIFGILQQDPDAFLQGKINAEQQANIERLLAERKQARDNKNWQQADKLRDDLLALGVMIEDTASGTVWRVL